MKDPSDAMQAAIFTALAASTALKALIGDPVRVYDKVIPDPTYPFVRIGDDQPLGDSNGCGDGWEFFSTIHIFSRHATAPRPEAKSISNAVCLALGDGSALISPSGFRVVDVELQQTRTFFEADGLTVHGIVELRFLVNDTA